MAAESLYIRLSPEVEALVADNGIDLVAELRKTGLSVNQSYGTIPGSAEEDQTKDAALIILASATAFGAVSMGIAHIIAVLGNKPVIVKNKKIIPVRDSAGNIERGKDGQPIMQEEEGETLVKPDTPVGSSIGANLGKIFSFEFATGKENKK